MAANFWTSSQGKALLEAEDLALQELHPDEAALGLSLSDLRLIKIHFCDHVSQLAPQIKVKQRVVATALLYLRRVFIRKSVVELDPRLVALTCLYLASKAEECPVPAKTIIKLLKNAQPGACGFGCCFNSSSFEMRDILEMEMRLLHALDYNLIAFHPYRPLTLLLGDARQVLQLPDVLRDRVMQDAWAMVNDSFRTDLCLLHPPHVIAAACLHLSFSLANLDARSWMQGLNLDFNLVQRVALTLLEHYQALGALTSNQIEASLKKLFVSSQGLPLPLPLPRPGPHPHLPPPARGAAALARNTPTTSTAAAQTIDLT